MLQGLLAFLFCSFLLGRKQTLLLFFCSPAGRGVLTIMEVDRRPFQEASAYNLAWEQGCSPADGRGTPQNNIYIDTI